MHDLFNHAFDPMWGENDGKVGAGPTKHGGDSTRARVCNASTDGMTCFQKRLRLKSGVIFWHLGQVGAGAELIK